MAVQAGAEFYRKYTLFQLVCPRYNCILQKYVKEMDKHVILTRNNTERYGLASFFVVFELFCLKDLSPKNI